MISVIVASRPSKSVRACSQRTILIPLKVNLVSVILIDTCRSLAFINLCEMQGYAGRKNCDLTFINLLCLPKS